MILLDEYCKAAHAYVELLEQAELTSLGDRYKDLYGTDKKINAGAGVYAIYENDKLMYIGRTDNIAQRLQDHYTVDAGASLAKKLINTNSVDSKRKLKQNKDRVKKMQVKFVKIGDENIQALTEILAYIALRPLYGNFKNH